MRSSRWYLVLLVSSLAVVQRLAGEARARPSGSQAARLVAALSREDAVARFRAEEQLVRMGDEALPALEALATSVGAPPARQYAINILARIGSREAARLLLRVLDQEKDVMVRAMACRHLGRMGIEEAVPIIGKWLFTIRGRPMNDWGIPRVMTRTYGWLVHVHALREIGSERGIPILQKMLGAKHGGKAGRALMDAYRENLHELKREADFWKAVHRVRGLEGHVKLLFAFFRKDTLALIRLYRDKVIRGGLEGRWVLEGMRAHSSAKLRQAATALLKHYETIGRRP